MADKTLSTIVGGGSLPQLALLTKKDMAGGISTPYVASLASGQALQTVLEITVPLSIGMLAISGSGAQTVDRIVITSDKGVLYDGDASLAIPNSSTWFLGTSFTMNTGGFGGFAGFMSSTHPFGMKSLKIELETTSSSSTINIASDLELIE